MYKTIAENSTFELIEKKSRFIANLMYIENKTDAETSQGIEGVTFALLDMNGKMVATAITDKNRNCKF